MASIAGEQNYTSSPDAVWKVLRNFGDLGWMPGVESCEAEGEGIGAVRRIGMGGNVVTERLESLDDGARTISYSIQEGPIPVQDYLATICVSKTEAGCRVDWTARFELAEGIPADAITKGLEGAYGGSLLALKKKLEA